MKKNLCMSSEDLISMNTDLIQQRMHQNCIKKNKNKTQKKKQTKRKKKYVRHYCNVCCKNYINYMSFKMHMKTFHGQSNLNKHATNEDESIFKPKRYFFELKQTKNGIGKTDNIFTEFEDQMPLELKNDQFRCNVCNKIFANSIDYMDHEKSHYQTLVKNNSSVSLKSLKLDNNVALDTFDVDGTITDTTNNDDKSLEIFDDDCTISNTSNNDVNSLDGLDYNISTSDITNNDTTLENCNYKIISNSDEGVFTSKSDTEEHQQYNINDNLRTCGNQTNLMFCEPNDLNTENNSLFDNKTNIFQKNTWVPDENHIKALNEICVVQQPFDCEICNETCDQFDHYQFHQWWSSDDILKCHVCNQKFSEKEPLKLHEYEHVKTHFC